MIYNLVHLVERSASLYPKKDAFRCFDKTLSYDELNRKSDQLALRLIGLGVQKGDRVGIYMNRCLETAIAVYGTMKSGAAYVPLDPFAPLTKTTDSIDDCDIKILLTVASQQRKIKRLVLASSRMEHILGIADIETVETTSWEDIFSTDLTNYRPLRILGDDLAFILYTSGSTGKPKGIMHTHRSGLSLAQIATDTYDFKESDVFGTPAPLHFDPSVFGYLVAPLVGATTIIVPDAHLKLPVSLSALIAEERVSVWYSVPLMLIQLLQGGVLEKHDFSSLRWVLFAGEVFIVKHLRTLMQTWPQARFSNLYGPAELILCTYFHVDQIPATDDPIPIGNVWADTDYKILTSDGQEVPEGEVGELVVRSATRMKGYWNNRMMTDKAFHKIRMAEGYDHIYYKTGDSVKQNPAGELLFLGRNDRQVKLRGYRVELDEVESVFLKFKNVQEAAVTVIDGGNEGAGQLIAFVKKTSVADIDLAALSAFAGTLLPKYALPETVYVLADFPRTSSGKIDRLKMVNNIEIEAV